MAEHICGFFLCRRENIISLMQTRYSRGAKMFLKCRTPLIPWFFVSTIKSTAVIYEMEGENLIFLPSLHLLLGRMSNFSLCSWVLVTLWINNLDDFEHFVFVTFLEYVSADDRKLLSRQNLLIWVFSILLRFFLPKGFVLETKLKERFLVGI